VPAALALLKLPQLLHFLAAACFTPEAAQRWQNTPDTLASQPLPTAQACQQAQQQALGLAALQQGQGTPLHWRSLPALSPLVAKLQRQIDVLPLADLLAVATVVRQGVQWQQWCAAHRGALQASATASAWVEAFDALLASLPNVEAVLKLLNRYLVAEATPDSLPPDELPQAWRDEASPALAQLRQQAKAQTHGIHALLNDLLADPTTRNRLQEPIITQRHGHWVLPVLATHKASFAGRVIDTSATGATLYMEPASVAKLHEKLQQTQLLLTAEAFRLQRELTQHLVAHHEALAQWHTALIALDERWAAGSLALALEATEVEVVADTAPPTLSLEQARHPLLVLQRRQAGDFTPIVANSLALGGHSGVRTLVITGPNTGGKTVMLTLVGLLAVMLRLGLPLPVAEGSRMSLFAPVLAAIGDAQSLEQNLSTFAAHMQRLIAMVDGSHHLERALVVIDEIMAGTDPVEGTALAKTLLQHLHQQGATTLVTTHLSTLKLEAHHTQGYQNASVLFDAETLSPTYRLVQGVPGTSHALTIAQRLGLPAPLVQTATAHLGQTERDSASLLMELESRRVALETDQATVAELKATWQAKRNALHEELQQLRESKKQTIFSYRSSLKHRLAEVEGHLKQLRQQLKHTQHQADTASPDVATLTTEARLAQWRLQRLHSQGHEVLNESLLPLAAEEAEAKAALLADTEARRPLAVGDAVKVLSMGSQRGQVRSLSTDGKKVQVQVGQLTLTVALADVQPESLAPTTAAGAAALRQATKRTLLKKLNTQKQAVTASKDEAPPSQAPVVLEADVRGQRVEEALLQVEALLNQALKGGHHRVGVIHGKGGGVLKKAVRAWLTSEAQGLVRDFYPQEARLGGDGVTIVELV
jgi:DNA mismatch repair protein MutS2